MFRLVYYFIKYCLYRIFGGFYALGWRVGFSHNVTINNPPYISLGSHVYLDSNVVLQTPAEHLVAGNEKPKIIIRNNVTISMGTIISAAKKIIIEDDVLISPFCHICDHIHAYEDPSRSIRYQGIDQIAPIHIKKGAWICTKVTVCPGITIGKNSVVGANSVVTKDIPDYAVAVGAPARVIKQYNPELKKWVNLQSFS